MTPVDQDIINVFRGNFESIKKEPIVLYGTGEKTKRIMDYCPDYHFIGIMDKVNTGMFYGLPILKEEDIKRRAAYIIIVCNISSAQAVCQRIESLSRENNIPVYHINGEKLCGKKDNNHAGSIMAEKDEYIDAIKKYDIISFDLFDTLITRECLSPPDLFDIMEGRLEADGFMQPDFARKRKMSEHKAFMKYGASYSLEDIYEEYASETGQCRRTGGELLNMELGLELEYARPRKEVVELLDFARQYKKRVILVSDMYLGYARIKMLLEACGIDTASFEAVYISNELSKMKSDGSLWNYLSERYQGFSLVHFGDNDNSDLLQARKVGFTAFPVYSGKHMARILLGETWFRYEKDLKCRLIMGLLIAEIFNSPFVLDKEGRIKMDSLEKTGYCFFGPLVRFFMDKLYRDARSKEQKIVFMARDGWILKKVADRFYSGHGVPSEYILTSRRAIAAAVTVQDCDIDEVAAIFGNTVEYTFAEFCHVMFGIRVRQDDPYYHSVVADINQEALICHLKRCYGKEIKEKACRQRDRYLRYLMGLHISPRQKTAFVNFVGSGVTQYLFEKLGFQSNSEFYYFALTPFNIEINPVAPQISYFQGGSIYTSRKNAVVEYTVLGECVFSSPASQFMELDPDCRPVYADDGVNHGYENIKKCHDGIERYVSRAHGLGICFSDVPSQFINETYGLLFDSSVFHVSSEVRGAFQMEDIVRSHKICRVWE